MKFFVVFDFLGVLEMFLDDIHYPLIFFNNGDFLDTAGVIGE